MTDDPDPREVVNTDAEMSDVADRIDRMARRARRDRRDVEDGIASIPDDARAMDYLRAGAGQAIGLYIEGRTGGRFYEFSPDQFDRLERAMNDWLECYARSYGVELDAEFTIRKAAEVLLETDNIRDTAALLTGIPPRTGSSSRSDDGAPNGR